MLRAFADLPERQVHYRHGGGGATPLVMLHASPGSSRQLQPLATALSASRRVIAPDTPGNGDSPALSIAQPEIADYAAATVAFLDALGLDRIDLYGSHTGASIAVEVAILAPDRVRAVVLDGIGLFSDEERAEHLAHYAPAITPDLGGAHLNWAFMFCRDQYLFWPWYKQAAENSRGAGLPSAAALHVWVLEVLKAIETYHLAYRASFRYPKRDRLPLVAQPLLLMAGQNDPLLDNTREGAALLGRAPMVVTPKSGSADAVAAVARSINDFLDDPDHRR
jgi:pimeloyl-ACP methyl ester carboxylesterase